MSLLKEIVVNSERYPGAHHEIVLGTPCESLDQLRQAVLVWDMIKEEIIKIAVDDCDIHLPGLVTIVIQDSKEKSENSSKKLTLFESPVRISMKAGSDVANNTRSRSQSVNNRGLSIKNGRVPSSIRPGRTVPSIAKSEKFSVIPAERLNRHLPNFSGPSHTIANQYAKGCTAYQKSRRHTKPVNIFTVATKSRVPKAVALSVFESVVNAFSDHIQADSFTELDLGVGVLKYIHGDMTITTNTAVLNRVHSKRLSSFEKNFFGSIPKPQPLKAKTELKNQNKHSKSKDSVLSMGNKKINELDLTSII